MCTPVHDVPNKGTVVTCDPVVKLGNGDVSSIIGDIMNSAGSTDSDAMGDMGVCDVIVM